MKDWGEVSHIFEEIHKKAIRKNLNNESEAQTRFDIIDRIIKEVLQWDNGQISVEEHVEYVGFIDYLLISGDIKIVIEAKKIGKAFPSPTKKKKLKVLGAVLSKPEIKEALQQAENYAIEKNANIVMVTNGECWCYYPLDYSSKTTLYANILFPFDNFNDAEELFNTFSIYNVENDSLSKINSNNDVILRNKLNYTLNNSDYRLGRNNIADYIAQGINEAIMSEALISDENVLKECYVESDNRARFDKTLQIHLNQYKPKLIEPIKTIKRNKNKDFASFLQVTKPNINTPVTLIIGSVGSGKTTYLKHFEYIKAKDILKEQKFHWIYVDFEKMGKGGDARKFLYKALNNYLLEENVSNPTDYENLIYPAYEKEIEALKKGPFAILSKNSEKFDDKISEIILKDFEEVEPYVEKVYSYIGSKQMCIIVIDNVDLYEDEKLETDVFSEAIALSKKLNSMTFISLRDSTYIKHKDSSIFNAYELNKFWINPPSFLEVLSKRLMYASRILKDQKATIDLFSGTRLTISDLGLFFKIVQKSVLNQQNSSLLEYLSDRNTRKGIALLSNFLTSGHVQADKALNDYINGDSTFSFPFHEIFKGAVLGPWKYYKEDRTEVLNMFDSGLGAKKSQLLNIYLLKYFQLQARIESTEISFNEIFNLIKNFGVSIDVCKNILSKLSRFNLLNSNENDLEEKKYFITQSGGYYITHLINLFVYIETVLYDTNIYDDELFQRISSSTSLIEENRDIVEKMNQRKDRLIDFFSYLEDVENESFKDIEGDLDYLKMIPIIKNNILKEVDSAIKKLEYRFHQM
ncbi:hypothetical protein [Myroides odoratimimus]|uniref:hypothetical protein n=1 Tax=Myroides odoratimimus TaxID=76832 RepID=UPI0025785F6E|nr:hypothetical protein [Myroides odoratimimus]MDM1067361.1 hypothetical protein [Myroides odoratimimus]